jgi:hypothetical protein
MNTTGIGQILANLLEADKGGIHLHNVHDAEINAYVVNLSNREITISLQQNNASADIIFTNVFAHYFENELQGSTIFEISENNVSSFLKDNEKILRDRKKFCWPIYYSDISELKQKLETERYIYYAIVSSYGLSGWVLAKKMDMQNMLQLSID